MIFRLFFFGPNIGPNVKSFFPNLLGENSQLHGDKIIRKNWLIKAFSNETRTVSNLTE